MGKKSNRMETIRRKERKGTPENEMEGRTRKKGGHTMA